MKHFPGAWQKYDASLLPFLSAFTDEMSVSRAYQGLKILHHLPLSIETVIKLHSLEAAGAEVVAIPMKEVTPKTQPEALEILKKTSVRFCEKPPLDETFDFYLDCCAGLSQLPPPKYGIVELTQTGSKIYRTLDYPVSVLSVDESKTKGLETFYGTGESFVRAFEQESHAPLATQNVVIFGYGRVGQGVAHAVQQVTDQLTIIDINPTLLDLAKSRGITAIDGSDDAALLNLLSTTSLVVTTTGIKGFVTKRFGSSALFQGKFLANMGGENEYGHAFSKNDLLFQGVPLNFSLSEPTKIHYLDPIFYAHNLAPRLILERNLSAGYHVLPEDVDREILDKWSALHDESIEMLAYTK